MNIKIFRYYKQVQKYTSRIDKTKYNVKVVKLFDNYGNKKPKTFYQVFITPILVAKKRQMLKNGFIRYTC